jgi:hypothetical protein
MHISPALAPHAAFLGGVQVAGAAQDHTRRIGRACYANMVAKSRDVICGPNLCTCAAVHARMISREIWIGVARSA